MAWQVAVDEMWGRIRLRQYRRCSMSGAGANGANFTHIVLERGAVPSQPMLTLAGRGTLGAQQALVESTVARLREAEFEVVGVKIEAASWNEDVPLTHREAEALVGAYFEHRVTVIVGDDLASLTQVAVAHAAHVSRNARRLLANGSHGRFVT
ncbi:hypothetical protein [Nonomuraea sp. KM90]|uniref:hypothetical protein n=1 Tax=Nonomuraea sp. KM90 TaxID=3457428 RepID=UPI003FCD553A